MNAASNDATSSDATASGATASARIKIAEFTDDIPTVLTIRRSLPFDKRKLLDQKMVDKYGLNLLANEDYFRIFDFRGKASEIPHTYERKEGVDTKPILIINSSPEHIRDWAIIGQAHAIIISMDSVKALTKRGDLPNLRFLNISRRGDIRDPHWGELFQKLFRFLEHSQITALDLHDQHIGPGDVTALAAVLPKTQITTLNLSKDYIGPEGVAILAAALPETQITTLNLDNNEIGARGIKTLAAALPETRITTLFLSRNLIGSEGAAALAAVLPKTQITTLGLIRNLIGHEGLKALVAKFPGIKFIF